MSQKSIASKIAVSKLFRGRNQGSDSVIGRDHELKALDVAWRGARKKNIITVVAWGGVGKTSLVAHWGALKLAQPDQSGIEAYFDWSFYSQGTRREGDAAGESHAASADLFLKEALDFFGDPSLAASNASAWQKGERLAQLVGNMRSLLVLDGIEPLQDARTGELRDDGLRALLRGLAAQNLGLCLVTTRQHLTDVNAWHQTTAPEWELDRLTDAAGAVLLAKLGVNGTEQEKRDVSNNVKGHALTLTLLGRYLKRAHHGDIRRVDRVDFQKVNEKEQGGHAFRVIAAYVRWFKEDNCLAELAILRMLGLFDRPATPDCLSALRNPPIPGLTETISSLAEDEWNLAVSHLVELGLVEERAWESQRIQGYHEDDAKSVWDDTTDSTHELGLPKENQSYRIEEVSYSLDTHPVIREYFGRRLRRGALNAWRAGHARLFEYLQGSVLYWPEGLEGLQPLYQAIAHGCQAGRRQKACLRIYRDRICRGSRGKYCFYSDKVLCAKSSNLAAVGCLFVKRWTHTTEELAQVDKAWLLNEAAVYLRARGRLTEAYPAMRKTLEIYTRLSRWSKAAPVASNLSELELIMGYVARAIPSAKASINFADRGDDPVWFMLSRVTFADALDQAGRTAEASQYFKKAEAIQRQHQPDFRRLYAFQGFKFCDLLLANAERAAWRAVIKRTEFGRRSTKMSREERDESTASFVRACRAVKQRASKALAWAEQHPGSGILVSALDHLTFGRAELYCDLLENSAKPSSGPLCEHIDNAVKGLRRAGTLHHLPRSLLTHALVRFLQNKMDLARAELDEAQQIAERGPMRLHMADIHLHRARLFRDQEELKRARALIEQCGYWRRKQELEDAEEAMEHW